MAREQLDERLYQTTAPNGLVVLTEHLPGLRSVAAGVWFRSASGHERREQMGIAHLLEHMVFKGTERRSAKELAHALEVRGGALDAYTSRDHTSFQAHVLDQDLPLAVEVLSDLVRRPLLRPEDLELERNVVLEEIKGVEDTPDDLVFDLASAALWPSHPYGYSILGTPETVGALTAADLTAFHRGAYHPRNSVIAAAGNVDHDRLLEHLAAEGWFDTSLDGDRTPPVAPSPGRRGDRSVVPRETAQAHLVLGTDTFASRDPRRFALAILVNLLGGGMSSRLFQRVREQLGLAYAIYAYQQAYRSAGLLGIYVAAQPAAAERAREAIAAELRQLSAGDLTDSELTDGKRQLQGQLMLALENPSSRMHRLAGFVLNDDRYRRLDEVLATIDAVSRDDALQVAGEFLAPERMTVVQLGG
ncbi:MAG: insulinase family protein [Gemmatimonadales bacterium]|nr:insulinase family protein [Gemmatimonadales bacterium]